MTNFIIKTIKIYKEISRSFKFYNITPFFYSDCKFYPTCSEYTVLAIKKHGLLPGLCSGFIRILKCNPFYTYKSPTSLK